MPTPHAFLEVFLPLFVTIDAVGMVPIFLGLTDDMSDVRRRRVIFEAVLAALAIALAFMLLGRATFQLLGITPADFKIAGGVILLVLAIIDLLIPGKPAVNETQMIGVVPLAMPLIAGPATLTTTLVLASRYGHAATALSLSVNLALLLAVLLASGWIRRVLGTGALRAFSKLVMVLLAAIAINYIRSGIAEAVSGTP